jgi:protein-tyrosine phosphatase
LSSTRPTYDDRVTERWIHLDGLVNMRDLGGLPTSDGGRTASGRLIRSDNLQDLTDEDVSRLVDELGVTDVVDLRTEQELHVEGPGPLTRVESLTHHHHSLIEERQPGETAEEVGERALLTTTDDDEGPRPARDAGFWAEHYLGYLSRRPDSVAAALRVVADSHGATVVHCAAGKDRTGTVVAMALDVAGVPREEIVADYVLTGERIDAIIGRLMPRPTYGEALAKQEVGDQLPRAESIEAILDAVHEGWGGAAGWLVDRGWSAADVERLRRRLTEPASR